MKKLFHALRLCLKYHWNQRGKAGERAVYHPLRVAWNVWRNTDNLPLPCTKIDLVCIALMHDTIEDFGEYASQEILNECGFRVWKTCYGLDKTEFKTYEKYIESISENPSARFVKWYDIKDNLKKDRQKNIKSEKIDKYFLALREFRKTIFV